jgi:hypothetical protein
MRATEASHREPCIHRWDRGLDEWSHRILRCEHRKCPVPQRERIPQIFQDLLFGLNIFRPVCCPDERRAGWRILPENYAIKREVRRR